MRKELWVPVAELASGQHGHVGRRQLAASGWSRSVIARSVLRGELQPVGPTTFRFATWAPTALGTVTAACLEVDGVASHRTAAWLHGFADQPRQIEVVVVRPRTSRRPGLELEGRRIIVHGTTSLPRSDVLRVQGVAATSAARSALGLAALVPAELSQAELVEHISRSIERQITSEAWLWWLLEKRRTRGRNGVIALEDALAEIGRLGPTGSWLEREFLRLVEQAGLPLPVTQRVVRRSRRFVARVDFSYEPQRLIVEVMGYAFHRTRDQLDADTRRANELQLLGSRVLQFTADQVVGTPATVLAMVARALACPVAHRSGA